MEAEIAIKPTRVAVPQIRFVTMEVMEAATGLTVPAQRAYIAKGIWIEGRQYVKRSGRILIDTRGYDSWAETGKA